MNIHVGVSFVIWIKERFWTTTKRLQFGGERRGNRKERPHQLFKFTTCSCTVLQFAPSALKSGLAWRMLLSAWPE